MTPLEVLAHSRALWNRDRFEIESDETLAQILDRGSLDDWRALYHLASEPTDSARRLRERIARLIHTVPTHRPHLWKAALASLGDAVDWDREPRIDPGTANL